MGEAGEMFRTIGVTANNRRFEVLEAGDGDRLALCLHGFPEHALSWHHQIPVLAGLGYRVWAVNQRGYGQSFRPTAMMDYALPRLLDDVAGLIDASGARSVVLIGHDWGALVAWCFAARRVRPLSRLVVLNVPHPLCFLAAAKRWRQIRRSWYVGFFQVPWLPDRLLARRNGAAVRAMMRGAGVDRVVLDALSRQIAAPGASTAMLNWYRALARTGFGDRTELAQPIETPTLVIWGTEDVALDISCLHGTEHYVTNLRIERLPGVSHWVQQHAPDRVNALLEEFLAERPAPSPCQ